MSSSQFSLGYKRQRAVDNELKHLEYIQNPPTAKANSFSTLKTYFIEDLCKCFHLKGCRLFLSDMSQTFMNSSF